MRKYEITDIQHPVNARLHRIKALIDILRWGVKAGDLGGYIQSENNLSQNGDCWVDGNGRVEIRMKGMIERCYGIWLV